MTPEPFFSLIVSTLGRASELSRLLSSLDRQTERSFELIVVDQNEDAVAIASVLKGSHNFELRHLSRPHMRGLSRGRNAGLKEARGTLVLFPDDDCWYPANFLAKVRYHFAASEIDFLCGRAADETGRSINGRFETRPRVIDRSCVWTTSIEWMQIYRKSIVDRVGGFDEDIGVGASTPWQSGEGQDLELRVLAEGGKGYYDPALVGHHEEVDLSHPDAASIGKMRRYARGMGFVLRKHRHSVREVMRWLLRPAAGAVVSMARLKPGRARLYANVCIGRVEGYVRAVHT